jgi:hypothetical protein
MPLAQGVNTLDDDDFARYGITGANLISLRDRSADWRSELFGDIPGGISSGLVGLTQGRADHWLTPSAYNAARPFATSSTEPSSCVTTRMTNVSA